MPDPQSPKVDERRLRLWPHAGGVWSTNPAYAIGEGAEFVPVSLVASRDDALWRCIELSGADTSGGRPSWPDLGTVAIQEVGELRANCDEQPTPEELRDAQAEVARLQARLVEVEQERDETKATVTSAIEAAHAEGARQERERLERELAPYLTHPHRCEIARRGKCTCGLAAVLSEEARAGA